MIPEKLYLYTKAIITNKFLTMEKYYSKILGFSLLFFVLFIFIKFLLFPESAIRKAEKVLDKLA